MNFDIALSCIDTTFTFFQINNLLISNNTRVKTFKTYFLWNSCEITSWDDINHRGCIVQLLQLTTGKFNLPSKTRTGKPNDVDFKY